MSSNDYVPPRSADELMQRYQNGERYFAEAELDAAVYDLRGVTLQGADFSRSYIVADFREADLRGVSFERANVKTCDFRGADLRNANFSGAALESTEFDGAKLEGVDFSGASAYGRELKGEEKPRW